MTDADWKRILSPEQFDITRRHGTEPAFTGEYVDNKKQGQLINIAIFNLSIINFIDQFVGFKIIYKMEFFNILSYDFDFVH